MLLLLWHDLRLMGEKLVLFVCVGNASRSVMAEAMFNANPPEGWSAISAGTSPAAAVNPRTGPMLRELGLEVPPHGPQRLTTDMIDRARVRITMGCLDDASCPSRLKTLELRDWELPDPANLDDAGFRSVRERLVGLVRGLRTELILSDRREPPIVGGADR
ncbi:MAG: low molecular weight phosphatase family protein [Thermoplasmata archaeon]